MISTEVSFIHHFEMTYNSQKFRLFEYTLFAHTYNIQSNIEEGHSK